MTGLCSADLCKMSVQEVADLLLEKLSENESQGKEYSMCKLHGCHDGRLFEMDIVMRGVDNDE